MGFLKYLAKLLLLSGILLMVVGVYFYDKHSSPELVEKEGSTLVNDRSGLNYVQVNKSVEPLSEQDIVDAITNSEGPISIGGARYSMGGQIAYPDSLHFDMRGFNKVLDFDPEKRLITVQSGITWHEVQHFIDPHNLSVKVMQDFNNFSVGGSLSVNAHGRFVHAGTMVNSVKSIRIVLANGKVYEASPENNNSLFYGAIGGYGAIGVITQATLELVDNIPIERSVKRLEFHQFLDYFRSNIMNDETVVLHNAVLYPPSYESLLDVSWRESDKELTEDRRLRGHNYYSISRAIVTDMVSNSNLLKRLRKNLIDPLIFNREAVVLRNWETSHDLHEFGFIATEDETPAVRVYFVPIDEFEIFVLKMRDIFIRNNASILNISIRYVPKDPGTMLAVAREDMFSFTIVYHQDKYQAAIERTRDWSSQLIQSAVESGGTYYMPFQIHETTEQFAKAYPAAGYFFKLKEKADPDNRFRNMLWLEHYAKNSSEKEAYYAEQNSPTEIEPVQKVSLQQVGSEATGQTAATAEEVNNDDESSLVQEKNADAVPPSDGPIKAE